MGFDLAHRYEPDCDDAYQDIVDYIRFEQETSKMWPWLISGDEMLAQETTLREIAGRLTAAGEWDTESIYESLTEAFGNNLSLDKQSKDDTKEEERNINIIVSTGRLKRIHEADQVLILADGLRIPIGDIVELESECIRGLL